MYMLFGFITAKMEINYCYCCCCYCCYLQQLTDISWTVRENEASSMTRPDLLVLRRRRSHSHTDAAAMPMTVSGSRTIAVMTSGDIWWCSVSTSTQRPASVRRRCTVQLRQSSSAGPEQRRQLGWQRRHTARGWWCLAARPTAARRGRPTDSADDVVSLAA